jgi:hypothetical protein
MHCVAVEVALRERLVTGWFAAVPQVAAGRRRSPHTFAARSPHVRRMVAT